MQKYISKVKDNETILFCNFLKTHANFIEDYCKNFNISGSTSVVYGLSNNAHSFSSQSDFIEISHNNLLETNKFSFDITYKPNNLSTSGTLLYKENEYDLRVISGYVVSNYYTSGGTQNQLWSNNLLNVNQYNEIIYQFNHQKQEIFINGNFSSSGAVTDNLSNTTNNLYIGNTGKTNSDNTSLEGFLDNIKINNNLINKNKILHQYNKSYPKNDRYQKYINNKGFLFSEIYYGKFYSYLTDFNGNKKNLFVSASGILIPSYNEKINRIAYSALKGTYYSIFINNLEGTNETLLVSGTTANLYYPIFDLNGENVFYSEYNNPTSIKKVNLKTKEITSVYVFRTGESVQQFNINPNNSFNELIVGWVYRTSGVHSIFTMEKDGTNYLALTPTGLPISNYRWHPNWTTGGTKIYYNDPYGDAYNMDYEGSNKTSIGKLENDLRNHFFKDNDEMIYVNLATVNNLSTATIKKYNINTFAKTTIVSPNGVDKLISYSPIYKFLEPTTKNFYETSDLVAMYDFNNNYLDKFCNRFTSTPSGNTTTASGFLFIGNDVNGCALLPNDTLNKLNDYTISFWYKADTVHNSLHPNDSLNTIIAASSGTVGNHFIIFYYGANASNTVNKWTCVINNDLQSFSTETTIHDLQWHHYAFVRSGTNLSYYIDGVFIETISVLNTELNNINWCIIGQEIDFNGGVPTFEQQQSMAGRLNHLMIYKSAKDNDFIYKLSKLPHNKIL